MMFNSQILSRTHGLKTEKSGLSYNLINHTQLSRCHTSPTEPMFPHTIPDTPLHTGPAIMIHTGDMTLLTTPHTGDPGITTTLHTGDPDTMTTHISDTPLTPPTLMPGTADLLPSPHRPQLSPTPPHLRLRS